MTIEGNVNIIINMRYKVKLIKNKIVSRYLCWYVHKKTIIGYNISVNRLPLIKRLHFELRLLGTQGTQGANEGFE